MSRGFTFIEVVVGSALFLIIAMAGYQAYTSLFILASTNQYKIMAIDLANEQFELIRNMPYSSVGIVNGIPPGAITEVQTITRGGVAFTVTTIIRNLDISFDGQVASSSDTSAADNKLAAITVTCATCKNFPPLTLTSQVAPKNLEASSTNGSLFIKAFDANGNAVQGASVHIVNSKVTPSIIVDDTTNNSGILQVIGVPPGSSAYNITVTKSGYSTDKTYPPGGSGNPTPTAPDATVLAQQVTSNSFSIDQLSNLSVSSVMGSCSPVPSVGFTLVGSKMIGTNVPKFRATTTTDGTGNLLLNNMEWDTYTFGLNSASYDLAGLNVLNPIPLNPNTTQRVLLVVAPHNPNSLMVTVKDSSTQLPISGVTVTLSNVSGYSLTQTTGQGFITQTDWSGGSGQADYSVPNKYFMDSGTIEKASPIGDLKLFKTGATYSSSGNLESSTIDTGTSSNFQNLVWLPSGQPVPAGTSSVKIQVATSGNNTATTTWTYRGPDGTTGTYYTSANSTIAAIHDGDRYFRYKSFLSTASATNTPDLSDVSFTYTTACTPPGQVLYQGLSTGNYTLTVSKTGYTTYSGTVSVVAGWKEQQVTIGP